MSMTPAPDETASATFVEKLDPRRAGRVAEALAIIKAAESQGVLLRLIGGLAVRMHCQQVRLCERDYSDIDLVGRRAQASEIGTLMADLGYTENADVRFATRVRQLQFYKVGDDDRQRDHYFAHPDEHVDVFLDTFRMDHHIDLSDRLQIEQTTISVSDALLSKLQIHRLNEKDLHDIVTLLRELPLGEEDVPGVINVGYIAELCAEDWGLHHDVVASLESLRAARPEFPDVDDEQWQQVDAARKTLAAALEAAPKSARWRLRAKIGERKPWYDSLEEQGDGD